MSRTLFLKSPDDAVFGIGDQSYYRLVPFRSIAVDRSKFPSAKGGQRNFVVLFVPGLKGTVVKLDDGTTVHHDGYLFAADTGSAIKDNHIDVFTGSYEGSFAPSVIKSRPNGTFEAYIVTDQNAIDYLKQMHLR